MVCSGCSYSVDRHGHETWFASAALPSRWLILPYNKGSIFEHRCYRGGDGPFHQSHYGQLESPDTPMAEVLCLHQASAIDDQLLASDRGHLFHIRGVACMYPRASAV